MHNKQEDKGSIPVGEVINLLAFHDIWGGGGARVT